MGIALRPWSISRIKTKKELKLLFVFYCVLLASELLTQLRLDKAGYLAHVGPADHLRFYCSHHLAHVFDASGATIGYRLLDNGIDFRFGKRLRQVPLKHAYFKLFDIGQVIAAGCLVLGDGIATLLEHLFYRFDHLRVVHFDTFIHFPLLDR